jgi:WD40 repeat protein
VGTTNVQPGPFISYAREDQEFVRHFVDALLLCNRDPWVDWELLPASEWMAEIRSAIDAAPAVVLILSPESAASPVCGQEIEHALAQNKRIIPIVCRTVDERDVKEAVRKINWIYILDPAELGAKIDTVISALDSDLEWVHAHARLLVRAQEWELQDGDRSLLLRGKELKEYEQWLARIDDDQMPRRTALQSKYVIASRMAETRRQRSLLVTVTAALLGTAALAVYAAVQSRIATAQRDTALSRMLAAQSLKSTTDALGHLDLGLLQSLAAYRIRPTMEAQRSLMIALTATNRIRQFVHTPETIVSMDVRPDGRIIASGDFHGQITLWDSESLRPIRELQHGRAPVQSVAFSRDGRTLASADVERVILWDASTGEKKTQIESNGRRWSKVAWLPGGATVLTLGGGIFSWDALTGADRGSIVPDEQFILRTMAVSPDGNTLACAGDMNAVLLWDAAAGKQRAMLPIPDAASAALAFNSDGSLLASGGREGNIVVWDMKTLKPQRTLKKYSEPVESIAFSPNGKTLVSGSRNNIVTLWNLLSGEPEEFLLGHTNGVLNLVFSRGGKELVSNSFDSTFIVWNLGAPRYHAVLTGHTEQVIDVAVSPDGSMIASASDDSTIRLWDILTASPAVSLEGHRGKVTAIAFSRTPDTSN